MSVIEKAIEQFPHTKAEDWRQVGEASIHKNCTIGERAKFLGPAICVGGTIRGGTIWGGTIWGGTIEGGTIRGGTIEGGTIKETPLQIFGACEFAVVIAKPNHIAVGCECHPPEYWREHIDGIARKHGVDDTQKAKVMHCVEIAAQWLIENPNAVVEDEPDAVAG